MNCLIVDDSSMARAALKGMLEEFDFLTFAGECEDVMSASNIMNKSKIDLLLMDVQMPEISGIDFLKNVKDRPLVILITAKSDYAVEAFEYNVVDYIVKPVKHDRFLKAVLRAKAIFESNSKNTEIVKEYFFFRENKVAQKLKISEINFIQAMGDYIVINTSHKKHTVHCTLSFILKELPVSNFMQIHRSYIVALDKIEQVEEGTVYISQCDIPIGNSHRSSLMKRLNLI